MGHAGTQVLSSIRFILMLTFAGVLSACGGGGGGGGGNSGSPTPTPEPIETPEPPAVTTLSLGAPTANPVVIPPSADVNSVRFSAVVRGTAYPEFLLLDEVDANGNVVSPGVAELRDDGLGEDSVRGDRSYSAQLSFTSVSAAEKFYRVRVSHNDAFVVSGEGSLWVSGCPSVARPSNPAKAVFDPARGASVFADEVLVTVANNVAPELSFINGLLAPAQANVAGCIPSLRQYLVEIPSNATLEDLQQSIATLQAVPEIVSVIPNVQVLDLPGNQSLNCDGQECQWYLERIRAPQAWALAGGGDEQVGVAVIDFGVDCNHQELGCDGNIFSEDIIDHGTGVASLIGARNNDGSEVVGVAWNTDLYPYSFIGQGGSHYKMSELITMSMSQEAIRVINISAATSIDPGNQVRDAMCNAIASGRLIVTAAGNAGIVNNCRIESIFPAQYNTEGACANGADLASGLIVVGATDIENNLAQWDDQEQCSNTLHVDLFAPGKDIVTASGRDGYAEKDGTSFAAPLASGGAAVVWATDPSLSVSEVHDRLVNSASVLQLNSINDRIASNDDRVVGRPLLDLYTAVGGVDGASNQDVTPEPISFEPQEDVARNTLVNSAPIIVSGVDSAVPIDVEGGFYSVDGGPFTSAAGMVEEGQTVVVQVNSGSQANSVREAVLTIGDSQNTFTATTPPAIIAAPDAYDFIDVDVAPLNSPVQSDILSISGLSDATPISIVGGQYAIDGGSFTSQAGTLNADQTIQLQVFSSAIPQSTNTATVTIGGVEDTFAVTTRAVDTSPNPFAFQSQIGVNVDTSITSTEILVSGINSETPVSVSGGFYSVDGSAFENDAGVVTEGQTVTVQHNSSVRFSTDTFTTLTIGDYSATFRSSTLANQPPIASDILISDLNGDLLVVGDTVEAQYQYSDSDGDAEGVAQFRWLRNGQVILGENSSTYEIRTADSGRDIRVEITPFALTGNLRGVPVLSTEIRVDNRAPEAQNLTIVDANGGSVLAGDLISRTYEFVDVDGDLEGRSQTQWLRNGLAIDGQNSETYIVLPSDVGQSISFAITPIATSGIESGERIVSNPVIVGNSPPVASNPLIVGNLIVGQTLSLTYAYSDIENDLEGASSVQWYRNDVAITGGAGANYVVTLADSGQLIRAEVTPIAQSGTVQGVSVSSQQVAINTVPEAQSVDVSDANGGEILTGDLLTASYLYFDADQDAEGASAYQWLRNGSPISGATALNYTLMAIDSGQDIVFQVVPVAQSGSSPGAAAQSVSVSIGNQAPTASSVTITDVNGANPELNDVLTGGYSYADAENDSEGSTSFRWLRNGSTSVSNSQNYAIAMGDLGQTLQFEVTPRAANGTLVGTPVLSPVFVVADNTAPTASSVVIVDNNGGSLTVGDELSGSYSFSDAENDLEGVSLFRWLRNGIEIDGANAATYTVAEADSGTGLSFEITPIADSGVPTGLPVVSAIVGVSNSAPVASAVSITDSNGGVALIGDTLVGAYSYSDVDGDPESGTSFRWLRNGSELVSIAQSYVVTLEDTGQDLVFEVTPRAGSGVIIGLASNSAAFNVAENLVPVASDVSVSDGNGGDPLVGDTLTASYTYSDAENDAEGTSLIRWLRDGAAIAGANSLAYTLVAEDSGREIEFEVTPIASVGAPTGAPVLSSVITVINSAPEASSLSITDENGGSLLVGDVLTATYAFSDVDNDLEGVSTYRWLRDGVAIDGAVSTSYQIVAADSGLVLTFEVTPVAQSGVITGLAVESGSIIVGNTAPEAQSVGIDGDVGGEASVGDTLTGIYTFFDADGDLEAQSEYQWFRNGVAISDATATEYLVVAADSGQTLSFEVTPIAATGTAQGSSVESATIDINELPVAAGVIVVDQNGGDLLVGDIVNGAYNYEDAEDDPQGTSTFRWLRNGAAIPDATGTSYSITLADSGQSISFEVTPIASAGSLIGAAVESAGIGIENSAPVASVVGIIDDNGGIVEIGDTLTGDYLYSDVDGDLEGATSFRWLRGATVVSTTNTYVVALSDNGADLVFEVTPRAATGTNPGAAESSIALSVPLNAAPTAVSVAINDQDGGDINLDDVLLGEYTFEDDDGDLEGVSTYRWLRNGAPIVGAVADEYTVVAADVNQNLSFEVTPIADTGVPNGAAVTSLASPVLPLFALTYTAEVGGTLLGNANQQVSQGSDGTEVTAVPNTGYQFVQWSDGLATESRTDTGVTENLSVSASFLINSYTVSTSIAPGGSVTPESQSVDHGDTASIEITPFAGFSITGVSGCGGSLSGNIFTTGPITEDCSISVGFSLNAYPVSAVAGVGGSVSPTSQNVSHGEATTVSVIPDTGYSIASVTGCGGSLDGNTYTTALIEGACTVSASFVLNSYSVTASAGSGGSISPLSQTVDHGSTTSFTLTPDAGYSIGGVTGCSGSLSGNTYTTSAIVGTCAVSASFVLNSYTVSTSAGSGGSVSPGSQSVEHGSTASFTISPDTGYSIASVSGCAGSLSGNIFTTASVVGACTVSATFDLNTYSVTASAGSGGSISPPSQVVDHGSATSFTLTPDAGYSIGGVTGCGGSLSGNTYTTGTIVGACAVSASFVLNSYTVNTSAGTGGSISPDSQSVEHGSTASFTISPDTGYSIASVSGCAGNLSGNIFTTGSVVGACTVSATFDLNTYSVTASAGSGGSISPPSQVVDHGSATSFTLTPDTGYSIGGVTGCSGSLSGNTYTTGSIVGACAVSASFVLNSYTVNTSAGTGGSISPGSQSVEHGSTASFTISPDTGYSIASVSGCAGNLSGNIFTTGSVVGACTVSATFDLNTYSVTASAGSGGAISPTSRTVNHGSTTSFTVTPDAGFSIQSVTGCSGSLSGNTFTTGVITEACAVSASFALNNYTVSTSAGTGGALSPTSRSVAHGSATTFTVSTDTGFVVDSVSGCGGSLSGNTYTTGVVTGACTVTAAFNLSAYTVSASAGTGGSISPLSRSVNHGAITTFTVTPDTGYSISSVTGCGGVLAGNIFTTSAITSACSVSATFSLNSYTVSASAGSGGTISPTSQSIDHGSTASFTITPNSGFSISSVTGCSGSLSGNTFTTAAVTGACTVSATFSQNSYTVSASAGAGGSISPTSRTVSHGGTTTFTLTADTGYSVSSVTGCGGSLSGNIFTTGVITEACSVTASFVQNSYTVSASAGTGGGISPTSRTVTHGATTTFTVSTNTGYSIASVTGCGGSLSGNTFTTGVITGACSVSASFSLNSYTVNTSAGSGGSISPTSRTVSHGSNASFEINPNTGYSISSVTGCGGSLSGMTYTTATVTGACTVSASFSINSYTVSTSAGSGGSISPTSRTINHGSTTTFTISPNTGFGIDSVTGCSGSLSGTTYTTGAITAACQVQASFVSMAPVVTLTPGLIKNFRFSWDDVSGETQYRILEDPDGNSGYTQIDTLAANTTSYDLQVSLPKRVNASYIVQACNGSGCVDSSPVFAEGTLEEAIGYVKASNTGSFDQFGYRVSLSGDGDTLAVGAWWEDSAATGVNGDQLDNSGRDSGAVYVFVRSANNWVQQAYIKASNTDEFDQFGISLDLSDSGDTLIVGANYEESAATGVNGNQADNSASRAGAAYVYTRSGSTWTQRAYLKASNTEESDLFGEAVGVSGDGETIAVSAWAEDSDSLVINGDQTNNNASRRGAVYVFTRVGSSWVQQAYIKPSVVMSDFGRIVELSDNGNVLALGTYQSGGSVHIFERTGSTWRAEDILRSEHAESGDFFGISMSMSGDGNVVAVGAHNEQGIDSGIGGDPTDNSAQDAGAAYVFRRSGGTWVEEEYFKASNVQLSARDEFGRSVAISDDGNTLAVSAWYEASDSRGLNGDQTNNRDLRGGAVYFFTRSNNVWRQDAYVKASNTDWEDRYGVWINLSDDGDTLVVGSHQEDGNSTGVNGDIENNDSSASGAVYIY